MLRKLSHWKRSLQQKLLLHRLQLPLQLQAGHAPLELHWQRSLVALRQTWNVHLRARQRPTCRSACGSRSQTALILQALADQLLHRLLLVVLALVLAVQLGRLHPLPSRCRLALLKLLRRLLNMPLQWLVRLPLLAAVVLVLLLLAAQVAQLQSVLVLQAMLMLMAMLKMKTALRMATALWPCSHAVASSASCSRRTLAPSWAGCCPETIATPSTSPSLTGRRMCGWCVNGCTASHALCLLQLLAFCSPFLLAHS